MAFVFPPDAQIPLLHTSPQSPEQNKEENNPRKKKKKKAPREPITYVGLQLHILN